MDHLRWFVEDQTIAFPAYTDPSGKAFASAGMKRGIVAALNLSVLANARRAKKAGFTQNTIKGDPLQQGGVLVIDAQGEVRYAHHDKTGGDHAPLEAVLEALADL